MFAFQLGIAFSVVFCIGLVIWLVGKEYRWWSWPLVLAVAVLPQLAYAQDAVPVAVDPAAIQALLDAAGQGKWVLALAIGISIVMGLLKWAALVLLKPGTKVYDFVHSQLGGWLLNFGGSLAAAGISLATGAASGVKLDAGLVISTLIGAVMASLGAAGAYQLKKDIAGAKAAGDAAAARVDTPAKQVDALQLPPK